MEEAGLPYRVRRQSQGAAQRSPEHLARQPFGQVPAIEDEGLALFESGAIALYIAERSDALLPTDRIEGRFTVGDSMMADVLRILRQTSLLARYPKLDDYKRRCEARPAFVRAMKAQMAGFDKASIA